MTKEITEWKLTDHNRQTHIDNNEWFDAIIAGEFCGDVKYCDLVLKALYGADVLFTDYQSVYKFELYEYPLEYDAHGEVASYDVAARTYKTEANSENLSVFFRD